MKLLNIQLRGLAEWKMILAARWQAINPCSNKQTDKQFSCDFGKNLSPLCRAKKKIHNFHHAICTHKEIYCGFFYHNNLAMNHCSLEIFCWFFFIQKNYQKKTHCTVFWLLWAFFLSEAWIGHILLVSLLFCLSAPVRYISLHTRFFCSIKMFRRYVQCTTYISWPWNSTVDTFHFLKLQLKKILAFGTS